MSISTSKTTTVLEILPYGAFLLYIPIPKRTHTPRQFSQREPGQKIAIAQRKRKIRAKTFKDPNMYPVKATVKANNPMRAKDEMTILSVQLPLINPV